MIFSKDKKPTEPGWYWYQPINGNLKPKLVRRFMFSGRLGCDGYGRESVNEMLGLWGDRIDTPTVEAE